MHHAALEMKFWRGGNKYTFVAVVMLAVRMTQEGGGVDRFGIGRSSNVNGVGNVLDDAQHSAVSIRTGLT